MAAVHISGTHHQAKRARASRGCKNARVQNQTTIRPSMVLSMCDEISHCYSTDKAYRGMHLRQFGNVVSGVYTPVLAKHSKHFMPADAIDIGSAAGFRTECFVFACRKSLPFLRQFAGKPRNRSLGAALANVEGSTYLGPRKPVPA
jgi:hypothetical protein